MNTYCFEVREFGYGNVAIKAESEQEARDLFHDDSDTMMGFVADTETYVFDLLNLVEVEESTD